jgi:hypothetical protein
VLVDKGFQLVVAGISWRFGLAASRQCPTRAFDLSSCIPPFAAVTLTLEDGAFPTPWRRAMTAELLFESRPRRMATGFLGLFYLKFLPVVFFPGGDPLMPKSPKTISM